MYVSKLTESAAATQLENHTDLKMVVPFVSVLYRKQHNTETVLLKVCNNILLNMNCQQATLSVLFDFSVAFDTVSNSKLLKVVCSRFGVREHCPRVA